MIITIKQPHGYLLDADGLVVLRFSNWSIGDHSVPDVVDAVEYVDGPADHDKPVADKHHSEQF